jgi:hypothetical protein
LLIDESGPNVFFEMKRLDRFRRLSAWLENRVSFYRMLTPGYRRLSAGDRPMVSVVLRGGRDFSRECARTLEFLNARPPGFRVEIVYSIFRFDYFRMRQLEKMWDRIRVPDVEVKIHRRLFGWSFLHERFLKKWTLGCERCRIFATSIEQISWDWIRELQQDFEEGRGKAFSIAGAETRFEQRVLSPRKLLLSKPALYRLHQKYPSGKTSVNERGLAEDLAPKPAMVVYTAITNHYDALKTQSMVPRSGAEFVAFSDHRSVISEEARNAWRIKRVKVEAGTDPVRTAKYHKILPHRLFPDAEYSLWIDGSVLLNFSFPIQKLAELFLKNSDLCVFRHPDRRCLYQEAEVCQQLGLDDPARIQKQIDRYRAESFPANAGLVETSVLLRRHSKKLNDFSEIWWKEYESGSSRDQISFNYAARKSGLRYACFPHSLAEVNGLAFRLPHRDERSP